MEISAADVERLVADLVAIDSVNPALVPGGAGEAEVMRFAAAWMAERASTSTSSRPRPGARRWSARRAAAAAGAR